MKAIIFKAFIALALLTSQPIVAQNVPRLPWPKGYVDALEVKPQLRESLSTGLASGQSLIGYYLPESQAVKILTEGFSVDSSFCRATLYKSNETMQEATNALRQLVSAAKKEMPIDRKDKDVDALLRHYEDLASKVRQGTNVSIDNIAFVSTIMDKETIYAASILVKYSIKEGNKTIDLPFSVSNAWLLFGTGILQVTVAIPFVNKTSIDLGKAKLLAWLNDVNNFEERLMKLLGPANQSGVIQSLRNAGSLSDAWNRSQVVPVVITEPTIGGFKPKDDSGVMNTWQKGDVIPVVIVKPTIGGFAPVDGSSIGNTWTKDDVIPVLVVQASSSGFVSYLDSNGTARPNAGGDLQTSSAAVIRSEIDGESKGWDGNTVVKLANGQIWKQAEYYYEYGYAYRPKVLVIRSGGGYRMKIDGLSKAVGVERLK